MDRFFCLKEYSTRCAQRCWTSAAPYTQECMFSVKLPKKEKSIATTPIYTLRQLFEEEFVNQQDNFNVDGPMKSCKSNTEHRQVLSTTTIHRYGVEIFLPVSYIFCIWFKPIIRCCQTMTFIRTASTRTLHCGLQPIQDFDIRKQILKSWQRRNFGWIVSRYIEILLIYDFFPVPHWRTLSSGEEIVEIKRIHVSWWRRSAILHESWYSGWIHSGK